MNASQACSIYDHDMSVHVQADFKGISSGLHQVSGGDGQTVGVISTAYSYYRTNPRSSDVW